MVRYDDTETSHTEYLRYTTETGHIEYQKILTQALQNLENITKNIFIFISQLNIKR